MITLTIKSEFTGRINQMNINCTQEQYDAGHDAYHAGALIQDAFPMLNDDEREFLLTGATPEEWEELFPPIHCDVCGMDYPNDDPCQEH